MTWRRIAPWLILVIAVLAIYVDLPRKTLRIENLLPAPGIGGSAKTVLGLDLQGGIQVTLKVKPQPGQTTVNPDDVGVARNIIEQRVGGIGVSEPQVHTEVSSSGEQRIVVDVPGVSNESEVRSLVGATGQLQFIDPKSQTLTDNQDVTSLLKTGKVGVIFSGGQIQAGSVAPDSQNGVLGVSFKLNDQANAAWCTYTTNHVNQPGPVALDGKIITTPNIQSAICSGSTIITVGTGADAQQQQTTLYNQLRYGALPVGLQEEGVVAVAPTLGAHFLAQALIAGAVGLFLVLLFMIGNYRLPGVLAALALVFYTLVNYAIFRILPVTLTLAGVAAFILSIGMAVDANILIFERMKEEIRAGKTLGPAIEAGFNRAWSSILDSNVSSLLVASWLYWQGTTVVRGFALVLIIGVLVSMFSAITVTRTMLRWVVRREWGRRIELYHVER